jgi:hypothetical protein
MPRLWKYGYSTLYNLPERPDSRAIAEQVTQQMTDEGYGFLPLLIPIAAAVLSTKEGREKAQEGARSLLGIKKKEDKKKKKKKKHDLHGKDPSKGRSTPPGPSHPGTSLTRPTGTPSPSTGTDEEADLDFSDFEGLESEVTASEQGTETDDLEGLESEVTTAEESSEEAGLSSLESEVSEAYGWMDRVAQVAVHETFQRR